MISHQKGEYFEGYSVFLISNLYFKDQMGFLMKRVL